MSNKKDITKAAIGLLGLPYSGKTAYIFACCISPERCPDWGLTLEPSVYDYIAELTNEKNAKRPTWRNTSRSEKFRDVTLFRARRRGIRRWIQPSIPVS